VIVTLPPDTLTMPLRSIEGRRVRTVSPLALFLLRAAFMETGRLVRPARRIWIVRRLSEMDH
jgi:hypothetical protein